MNQGARHVAPGPCPRALRCLLLLLCVPALPLAPLAAQASDRLQIAPDDDFDLAQGFAAYQQRDARKAAEFFRKAAAARNQRTAQFNLAVMLLAGDGVPNNSISNSKG